MEFRCLRSGQQYWKKSDFHTQMIFKATLSPYALSCATTYTPLVFIFAETSSHQLWHLQTRCSHTVATWFTEHTQNLTFSLTQKHPVRRVICNVHHTLVVKRSCWKQIKLLQPPRRAPEQQGEQGTVSPSQTWDTTGVCTDPGGVQVWGTELYLVFVLTLEHVQAEVSSPLFQTVHKQNI